MARKQYDKKTFEINENLKANCWSEDTSYGFRHLAELDRNYCTIATAKCAYYNRTWERYTYESVLNRLLENSSKKLTQTDKDDFKALIESDTGVKKDMAGLSFIAGIAKLGEFFTDTKADSNAWKTKMLKAGIPQIDFPDDFDSLPEDEKARRLNGAIDTLSQEV